MTNLNDPLTFDAEDKDTVLMLSIIERLADTPVFPRPAPRTVRPRAPDPHPVDTERRLRRPACGTVFGQVDYGRTGILDRTHTQLFTFRTFEHLLHDAGFRVKVVRGVPAPFPLVAEGAVGKGPVAQRDPAIRVSKTLFSFRFRECRVERQTSSSSWPMP